MVTDQVYENNIHTTMKQMPAQRERRKKDYERVLTLFSSDSFAKDKRNKVTYSLWMCLCIRKAACASVEVHGVCCIFHLLHRSIPSRLSCMQLERDADAVEP